MSVAKTVIGSLLSVAGVGVVVAGVFSAEAMVQTSAVRAPAPLSLRPFPSALAPAVAAPVEAAPTNVVPDAGVDSTLAAVPTPVEPAKPPPVPTPVEAAPKPPPKPAGEGLMNMRASDTADVFVDGKKVGQSPMPGFKSRAGAHKVRFDCYDAAGNVVKGEVQSITVPLDGEVDVEYQCPAE